MSPRTVGRYHGEVMLPGCRHDDRDYHFSPVGSSKSSGKAGPPAVAPMKERVSMQGVKRANGFPSEVTWISFPADTHWRIFVHCCGTS